MNEDPTEKLIRELKEENEKLMEMLKKAQSGEAVKLSADDDDDDDDESQKEGMSEEGKSRTCYLGEFVYLSLSIAALLGEWSIKKFTWGFCSLICLLFAIFRIGGAQETNRRGNQSFSKPFITCKQQMIIKLSFLRPILTRAFFFLLKDGSDRTRNWRHEQKLGRSSCRVQSGR